MGEEEDKKESVRLFNDFFDGGEKKDILARINRRMADARGLSPHNKRPEDPLIYGLKMTFRAGEPRIEEFGNMRYTANGLPIREPLTDVLKGRTHVSVIMELPGVRQQDIDLKVEANKLYLNVESGNRIYSKEVSLDCIVDPDTVDATFKNGILEARINLVE